MRNLLTAVSGALVAATMFVAPSFAEDFKPAIIYDMGGKFDKSFNEAGYNGAEKFKTESGTEYRDFEIQNPSQREQMLRQFARRGFSPVVVLGFAYGEALGKVAPEFPDTKFAIVDMFVDAPNVRSIGFKEHEGSYIVGVAAAKAAASGKVGFVGGMDIPLIRRFACGYAQGVKAANADAEIFQAMTGSTPSAWNDPVKGGEITKSQIDQGADVVYHAAGGTGVGVLQAAADAGKLGIGVDSNQNGMHPGKVLTSMLKRVDVAVYNAFKDAQDGKWTNGGNTLGLAEGGVDWALDDNNASLVSDDMKAAVEAAKAGIIDGSIAVHDFTTDSSCPVS